MTEPVVITGAGLVTPLGLTREETWRAVLAQKCGVGPLTALEQPERVVKGGGQAPDLPEDFARGQPREARYLRWAVREALRDAGVDAKLPCASNRCGFMMGTTLHGMRGAGRFLRTGDYAALGEFLAASTLRAAAEGLAIEGPAATTCSACSSSLGSIALAVTLLESGQLDLVIAGGYDTISEYAYAGFNALRLVADEALRPFARDRQGMKLAEGYGIVVLERQTEARNRGASILAVVRGWGESADAHHLTQPHPEGEGAARAMEAALARANFTSAEIDLIAAHATGTPDNDAGEYAALRRVFGDGLPRVPVVGFKSHLGHTLGGAGACELILSALALRDQIVPGCANVATDQTDFPGLNLATATTRSRIRATLNTSLGFGGANTCIILTPPEGKTGEGKAGTGAVFRPGAMNDVFITGIGVMLPGVASPNQLREWLASANPEAKRGPVAEETYLHLLNARRVRRMSEYVRLTLAATTMAIKDAQITDVTAFAEPCAVILGTTHGSTNYSTAYYRQIVKDGIGAANPMMFAEGVPNAAAAHLSLMLSLKGACQTVIGSRTSGLDALRLAALRIAHGDWDRAIVGAAEEYDPLINASYQHCGGSEQELATCAAAVTFILESRQSAERRNACPHGRLVSFASARPMNASPIEAALRVLADLDLSGHVLCSRSGSWLERAELAAVQRSCRPMLCSLLCGLVAECFSAAPLLSIVSGLRHPNDELSGSQLGVICADHTGIASGAVIERLQPRAMEVQFIRSK